MAGNVQQNGTAERLYVLLRGFTNGQQLRARNEPLERTSFQLSTAEVLRTIGAGAERDDGRAGRLVCGGRRNQIAAGQQVADRESIHQKMSMRIQKGGEGNQREHAIGRDAQSARGWACIQARTERGELL